jgi:hypothetical protein
MKPINKRFLIILLVITIFGGTGFVVWNSVQSRNLERVSIENKTRSLKVESIRESVESSSSSFVEITFRNTSDKPIGAYRIRVSEELEGKNEQSAVERGGLLADWVLNSNEIKVEKFYINPKGKTHLTVAAVIFEDGAGDGEIDELNRLREIRVGVRLGFQKIVPIFQEVAKTNQSLASGNAIESLVEKVKQLDDRDVPDDSKRGFALAKSYVSIELEDLAEAKNRNPNVNLNNEVASKLTKIESALTKLSINLPSGGINQSRQNED